MTNAIRRIDTGHVATGKAVVFLDDAPSNVKVRKACGKLVSSQLRAMDESPAKGSGSQDRSVREIGVLPPLTGLVFRLR